VLLFVVFAPLYVPCAPKNLINLDVLEDGANELAGSKVSDGAA
jgi:hypothetical protein